MLFYELQKYNCHKIIFAIVFELTCNLQMVSQSQKVAPFWGFRALSRCTQLQKFGQFRQAHFCSLSSNINNLAVSWHNTPVFLTRASALSGVGDPIKAVGLGDCLFIQFWMT